MTDPRVVRLHAEVDRLAAELAARHGPRLRCGRGCAACCVDGITVFEVEADRIRDAAAALLATGTPHPAGACAFLGPDGACRVYDARPYVCRVQGLPQRWLERTISPVGGTADVVELRDLCPLNEPDGPPLEALPDDACWTLGPVEEVLRQLQQDRDRLRPQGDRARADDRAQVSLRSLFGAALPG